MRTSISKLAPTPQNGMALLLFALCLQGLVYGQKPKETDFCALELHPGIDTSWVDSRFAPLITKAAVPHPSMVIYELILDFEFEFEKLAALFEYRFQGNSCHYTAYRVDGSVIGNLSGQRRFDATELGHALHGLLLNSVRQTTARPGRPLPGRPDR